MLFPEALASRTQDDALQCLARRDKAPERDEQLACQRDDHRLARANTAISSSGAVPQCQCALLLKPQKAPGELDHTAADPGVACFGEPLFPPLRAALVRPVPRWSCGCNGSHRAHHPEPRLPRPWRDDACRGGTVRESAPVRIRRSCPGTAASVDLRACRNAALSERSSRLRNGQTLRSAGLDRHIFYSSGRVNGSEPPECDPRQRDRAVAPALAAKDWRRRLIVAWDGTLELFADDAEAFIRNGWVKLGEWIEDEPPEGEQIAEQNKPKVTYAPGSLEWEAQQEQERLARIAAEEEKEKRRLARVAAVLGKKL